jgi:hypothetical protein
VYVAAPANGGNDETGKGTETLPYKTLAKAVWKARAALDEDRRTVVVVGELSEESGNEDADSIFCITDTGAEGVTIRGKDANAMLKKTTPKDAANRRRILYLGPETKVALKSITITGGYTNRGAGVFLDGGDLSLGDGASITGNTQCFITTSLGGAGIYALSASLTLLPGCKVSNNTLLDRYSLGAGIFGTGTTVIMKGGAIADNVWEYTGNYTGNHEDNGGAGIHLTTQSAFTMTGGEISGNKGFRGGGVVVREYSSFTMEGGSITGNEGYHCDGGVLVSVYSQCTIKGGYITNNTALNRSGGGLEIDNNSTGVMEGGFITGNTANYCGGGLQITNNCSFTMKGGEITDNTAGRFGGGGVAELLSSFRMEGGLIARNTATVNTGTIKGGGVLAKTFTMTGGTIYGTDGGANANNDSNSGAAAVFLYTANKNYIGGEIFTGTTTSINDTIHTYTP